MVGKRIVLINIELCERRDIDFELMLRRKSSESLSFSPWIPSMTRISSDPSVRV